MKIYLIRHGIAELKAIEKPDAERMLTKKGIIRTQKIAQKLASLSINFDLILTSPYRRAKETAIILQQAKLAKTVIEHSSLKPNGNILEWINWMQTEHYPQDANICLVGHQPTLSEWAELLIWNQVYHKMTVKKAGIIGLNLINWNNPLGEGELFLLTSPKWMIN
jgi:phosphohistidine phosphatase